VRVTAAEVGDSWNNTIYLTQEENSNLFYCWSKNTGHSSVV